MLVSYNWLREYVPIEISPEELSHRLTMAGLEVSNLVSAGENLGPIRVAKIEDISAHPNAQRLSLCRIFDGKKKFTVVCGATNMKPGDKVAFAPLGTTLPNGITIKASNIRGITSEGMLCSEEELKLEEKSTGIMILPLALETGKDLASALLLRDYVLEIDLTPNRADCLSMIGIAREVAALLNTQLSIPPVAVEEEEEDVGEFITVTIEAPEFCPRYTARYVSQVNIQPSPLWMRRRLELAGIRSINNVVDVTNYILLEWGQPMHAFDYSRLDGGKIIVKTACPGETFTTLDDKERSLDEETLMICDASKYIAIGGIMGGLNTGVTEDTTAVLLESAYFNPRNIRKTSKKLGIKTESSLRFEKGINRETVVASLNRAAQLIATFSGGNVARGVVDVCTHPIASLRTIALKPRKVNRILGTDIAPEKMLSYLERLQIPAEPRDGQTFLATIPPYRGDIKEDIDLIEEIARIHGYDHIPATLPKMSVSEEERKSAFNQERAVRPLLADSGFFEVITYSFIAPENIEALQVPEGHSFRKHISISNPLSRDQSILRTTLLPGLLQTVAENFNHNNMNLKFFELGRTFLKNENSPLPQERYMLGVLMCGLRTEETWNYPQEEVDFYDLKGVAENIFQVLSIQGIQFQSDSSIPYFHPGLSSRIFVGDRPVGMIGEVRPHVLDNFGIFKKIFVFEIDFGEIIHYCSKESKRAKPLPKFPPIYRDIALIVENGIENKIVEKTILDSKVRFLEEVRLFDVYQGEPICGGKKSLAYRMKFQAQGKSLTDEEVNKLYEKIFFHLTSTLDVELRK